MRKTIARPTKILVIIMALMVGMTFTFTDEVHALRQVGITDIKSADYNAVKISWSTIKSAETFQVYRSTSKSGKYKKIATTSSASYTDKKLTTGKKYYYKVRVVNGSETGSFSNVKSATPKLKTPSVTVKTGKTSVKLSWKKVNGAKGYQIYRATKKNGKYKKVKTTSSTSWTNTKLSAKKKYYYKVRAYRKSGNKTLYSAYRKFFATPGHKHTWEMSSAGDVHQYVKSYNVCHGCGMIEASSDHVFAHINAEEPSSSHVDSIVKSIYTTNYRCSCGAEKSVKGKKEHYEIQCAGTVNCRKAGWVAPYAKTTKEINKEHNECKRILKALKQGHENIEPPMGVSIPKHTHRWWAEYATKDVQVGTEQKLIGTYYTCDGCGKEMTDADYDSGHLSVCGSGTETLQYKYEEVPIYETEKYISKFNCVCGKYCLWPNKGARVAARCEKCGELDVYMVNDGGPFLCFRCK